MKAQHLFALVLAIMAASVFTACTSVRYQGPQQTIQWSAKSHHILLIPYENATNNESASTALTEMTASALNAHAIRYTKSLDIAPPQPAEGEERLTWMQYARTKGYSHILSGTVTEYHYKTDLDGDPAVGLSVRLEQVSTEKTIWQGSSSATGYGFASLSSASQKAVDRLVVKMFVKQKSRS